MKIITYIFVIRFIFFVNPTNDKGTQVNDKGYYEFIY